MIHENRQSDIPTTSLEPGDAEKRRSSTSQHQDSHKFRSNYFQGTACGVEAQVTRAQPVLLSLLGRYPCFNTAKINSTLIRMDRQALLMSCTRRAPQYRVTGNPTDSDGTVTELVSPADGPLYAFEAEGGARREQSRLQLRAAQVLSLIHI